MARPWLHQDADDEFQLQWASAHDRVLFTFNIGDYLQLARRIPEHKGFLLANPQSFSIKDLIALQDRALDQTAADDWLGQVHRLSDWR